MVALFGGRRKRIRAAYEALCAAIATALGGSAATAERVRREHLDVFAELWLREDGPTAARTDPARERLFTSSGLAGVVRRVEGSAAAAAPLEAHVPELERIVAAAATGPAGRHPKQWLGHVNHLEPGAGPPQLWRIGQAVIGGSDPFAVAVPLLDESHLQISTVDQATRKAGLGLVEGLLMRVLSSVDPGSAVVHVWDVGQLTGPLPDLHPLSRTGLLTVHDPSGLAALLEELSDRIRRVHNRVLVDGQSSLAALASKEKRRPEPWVIAVLVGNRQGLPDEEYRQLQRVARGGLACGVHLVMVDVPMALGAPVETVKLGVQDRVETSMTDPHMTVRLDEPLAASQVTEACRTIADADERRRERTGTFADLLPKPGAEPKESHAGLVTPIGFVDGDPVDLELVDASPHALIGGPSGSGKTNLLLAMIAGMASRYGPRELEFYLLDFKEGVSFAQLAPGRKDETWLPQARLIGININTDREFGLALLRFLSDELRRRAEAAKEREVTKLEELRRADPKGRWPRIVAVIDEFQYLFSTRDAVTTEAIRLLEDVARRGRSQGIHLVLASQDVSSIDAFWGRPAIFEQFVLRIALPRARRILDDHNDVALHLPRWHAVINHESGMRHGNRVVRVPNASEPGTIDEVQKRLHEKLAAGSPKPRLFDGSRSPSTGELLAKLPEGEPLALVGQLIDVAGSPAAVRLPPVPGRNLIVLGPGERDAVRLIGAAGAGLAATFAEGTADVVLAALVPVAQGPAERLGASFAERQHGVRWVALDGFADQLRELSAEVTKRLAGATGRPTVVVLYAADAADAILDRTGTEDLRRLVHYGPEVGVHVVGWWRSVPRLRSLLMMGASVDDIGAWVALDVQGTELQPLLPGLLLNWSPRPGRGLWFDRAQHANPEVVIVPSSGEGS